MKSIIKIIFAVCILFTTNCFAMQFSKEELLGEAGWSQIGHGFVFTNATYNMGDRFLKYKANAKGFGQGYAVFGKGEDELYIHYNAYINPQLFSAGDRKQINSIRINIPNIKIYKISADNRNTIYALCGDGFELLGKRGDGRFIKYADGHDLSLRYYGKIFAATYKCVSNGDSIDLITMGGGANFRFKWDESAQWFSVNLLKQ